MPNRSRFFPFLLLLLLGSLPLSCDDQPTGSENDISYSHSTEPGTAAGDLITDETFTRLVVEIDYMEGYEPQAEAIQSLESFLGTWLDKSDITVRAPSEIPGGGQESYSPTEVRELEQEHRDSFSDRETGTLNLYTLILDGEYSQSNVLGIAYYNTSMALFGATIAETSGGIGGPTRSHVESTVWQHETGHLMGLVNAGTEMQQEHEEEPPNGAHCTNEECLMYYAFRNADLFRTVFGEEVPELDAFCQEDLAAAKEG